MTPETFTGIRARAGLTQSDLADYLRVTLRAVQYYEGGRAIPGPVTKLMEQLDESCKAIAEIGA